MPGPRFPFFLPSYAQDLLSHVESLSGKPVLVREVAGLGHDSETRPAGRVEPVHELCYRPEYRDFALHFFVNACKKLIRMFELPPEERYLPASDPLARLPDDEHRDLAQRIEPEYVEGASLLLQQGLVRQLTSFPVDLRVERELHTDLQEHRRVQLAYLERQIEDLEEHFSPAIAMWAPKETYAATSAMNVALTKVACELAGMDVPEYVLESPHRPMGRRLLSHLRYVREPGLHGDRRLTDAWAGELRLDGTYQWVLTK